MPRLRLQLGQKGPAPAPPPCVKVPTYVNFVQYTVWLKLVEEVSLDLSVSLETTDRDQVRLEFILLGHWEWFYLNFFFYCQGRSHK